MKKKIALLSHLKSIQLGIITGAVALVLIFLIAGCSVPTQVKQSTKTR